MGGALSGRVALVAGATRGAGRGIAVQLGACGATVYCTGRSTRSQRSEMNRAETIEETAALVDAAGGRGIAVQVDHLEPGQVRALVERIEREQGSSAHPRERHLRRDEDRVEQVGVGVGPRVRPAPAAPGRGHARDHEPLRDPAAAEVSGRPGRRSERRHGGVQRRDLSQFVLLRPGEGRRAAHGLRTRARAAAARRDRRLAHAGLVAVGGDAGRLRRHRGELARRIEVPAALRASRKRRRSSAAPSRRSRRIPNVSRWNGQSLSSGQLAKVYGFTDLDGSQPDAWRYLVEVQDPGKPADMTGYR